MQYGREIGVSRLMIATLQQFQATGLLHDHLDH
jgi:hypothetical protein